MWRAGGGSFGGEAAIPSGAADYAFSLNYDPNGAGGMGTISATLGSYSAVLTLDAGHKADGAIFNRFGILNVMKSSELGVDAAIIGEVTSDRPGTVTALTSLGAWRFVDMPMGELLPRIC